MRTIVQATAALLAVLSTGTALADEYRCSDPLLTASAPTAEVGDKVCTAATAAKDLLVSCGLTQTYTISIDVVDIAQHPIFGDCLALYDQRTGCLQVTDPHRLPTLLPQDDPRAGLPPEVLFAATITHEMAHALLQQTAAEREIAATEQEFVANALEMQSLAPEWRAHLLRSHPVNPPGSLGLVHLSIYALDPRAFANNAWMVFDQEVMGCSLVRNIAAGTFRFPRH